MITSSAVLRLPELKDCGRKCTHTEPQNTLKVKRWALLFWGAVIVLQARNPSYAMNYWNLQQLVYWQCPLGMRTEWPKEQNIGDCITNNTWEAILKEVPCFVCTQFKDWSMQINAQIRIPAAINVMIHNYLIYAHVPAVAEFSEIPEGCISTCSASRSQDRAQPITFWHHWRWKLAKTKRWYFWHNEWFCADGRCQACLSILRGYWTFSLVLTLENSGIEIHESERKKDL